jgi:hypothetical protein
MWGKAVAVSRYQIQRNPLISQTWPIDVSPCKAFFKRVDAPSL